MPGARLLRLLTLVALVLAPLGMMSSHAAMAAPAAPMLHHGGEMASDAPCPGMDQPSKPQPASCIDCIMVLSAIPAAAGGIAAHPVATAPLPRIPLDDLVGGLHPESDPPPPRIA